MTSSFLASFPIPLLGFAAYSGTGKTTLLCKLIPLLNDRGIRVAVIKNTHHDIEIDQPQKDSYKIRQAGAAAIVLSSPKRTAMIIEYPEPNRKVTLEDTLKSTLNNQAKNFDLILVEGFKESKIPKIELHRKALDKPYLYPNDKNIIAIATDYPLQNTAAPRLIDLNTPQQIADFIKGNLNKLTEHQ